MDDQHIKKLAQKIIDGSITDVELEIYNNWYYSDNGESYRVSSHASRDELAITMYTNIAKRAGLHGEKTKKYKLWPQRPLRTRISLTAAAAIAIIAFGTGLFFYNQNKQLQTSSTVFLNDVPPGKNGATLTLANGHKISINDALTGNIANEAGVRISKAENGQLIYEVIDSSTGASGTNTLSTSRSEQTQVRLPDGTSVWLNAASSISYPSSFSSFRQRNVKLEGEAYFEVAKDRAHPFIVITNDQQVEVLGTHFNVRAYPGTDGAITTLVEGSVKVGKFMPNAGSLEDHIVLKPNEQSVLTNGKLTSQKVAADDIIAWKDGFFTFNNESLEKIMDDVARWYNVEIIYRDDALKHRVFFGSVNRFNKISKLLSVLESTNVATFQIKGNQIIISKKTSNE